MPTGERGVTYLLLLFWLTIAGTGLAAAGTAWSTAAQRGKEAELRFRGEQYRRAIESYQRSTPPGAPREPMRLDELLDDRRGELPRRHLRRLYTDPFTGTADWELVRNGERIRGVRSRATVPVLRAPPGALADGKALASNWIFAAAEPASAAMPSRPASAPAPRPRTPREASSRSPST